MTSALNNKLTFKKIYTQYFSVLVNFAFSKTLDWQLSQEIVQNTFAKLWCRRKRTKIKCSLTAYLFIMVRNAILDHSRRSKHNSESRETKNRVQEAELEGHCEENIFMIRHMIKKALDEMKPKRKLIFELSKFEGLTYSEIANHLAISERAVEDNMAKALLQLEVTLKKIKQEF